MHFGTTTVQYLRFCGTCGQSVCLSYVPLSKWLSLFIQYSVLVTTRAKGHRTLLHNVNSRGQNSNTPQAEDLRAWQSSQDFCNTHIPSELLFACIFL